MRGMDGERDMGGMDGEGDEDMSGMDGEGDET